jgi:hypothetical protein
MLSSRARMRYSYFQPMDSSAAARREHHLWLGSVAITMLNAALIAAFVLPRWSTLGVIKLRYTAELGVNWVGDWRLLALLPGLSAVSVALDWLLARRLRRTHPSLGELAACAALLVSMAFAGATIIALLLNAAAPV